MPLALLLASLACSGCATSPATYTVRTDAGVGAGKPVDANGMDVDRGAADVEAGADVEPDSGSRDAEGDVDGGTARAGSRVAWVPSSTLPLVQLVGEQFQLFEPHGADGGSAFFVTLTGNQTLANYGAEGADLGIPVRADGKILYLFGDTTPVVVQDGGYAIYKPWSSFDSIGLHSDVDLSGCHYMQDVHERMAAGESPADASLGACPDLQLFRRSDYLTNRSLPTFHYTAIDDAGEGAFKTATGAIVLNDRLYAFYQVQPQFLAHACNGRTFNAVLLHTELVEATAPVSSFANAAPMPSPPLFTKIADVSEHTPFGTLPTDSNGCAVAPPVDTTPPAEGKFVEAAPLLVDPSPELRAALPPELSPASPLVFVFGSSWRYHNANLYLAVFGADDIETGTAAWWYLTGWSGAGQPEWTQGSALTAPDSNPAELAAIPLIRTTEDSCLFGRDIFNSDCHDSPELGEHAVIWEPALGAYLLFYAHHNRIVDVRSADLPWGPWSDPIAIFDEADPWYSRFVHAVTDDAGVPADPIQRLPRSEAALPAFVTGSSPAEVVDAASAWPLLPVSGDSTADPAGAPYAPYPLPGKDVVNADGSVTIYFTLSTWNPYAVFLMKTTLCSAGSPGCGP
jgi:hypothetical protein